MIRLRASLLLLFCSMIEPTLGQSLKYTLSEIEIRGNERTRAEIILRELPFESGDQFTWEEWLTRAKGAQSQLNNLNLFQHVEVRIEKSTGIKYAVQAAVILIEKWYVWPIPYIEFADRNFTQWQDFDFDPGRTNYGLYVFWYNLAGRNQTLKLSLGTGYTRVNGFEFRSPPAGNFRNWGWSMSAHHRSNQEIWYNTRQDKLQFLRSDNREMFQRREYLLQVQYRKAAFNRHGLSIFYHDLRCDSIVLQTHYNPAFLGGKTQLIRNGMAYRFTHESRDNKFYPLSGKYLDAQVSLSYLSTQNALAEIQYQGSLQQELNRGSGWYAAAYHLGRIRFHSGDQAVPFWLNRNVGYEYQLRGYERYVVDGETLLMGKLSLRKSLLQRKNVSNKVPIIRKVRGFNHIPLGMYAGIYCDAAWAGSRSPDTSLDNQLPQSLLIGAGIGVDFHTYTDKVLRLELSRNRIGEIGLFVNFRQAF